MSGVVPEIDEDVEHHVPARKNQVSLVSILCARSTLPVPDVSILYSQERSFATKIGLANALSGLVGVVLAYVHYSFKCDIGAGHMVLQPYVYTYVLRELMSLRQSYEDDINRLRNVKRSARSRCLEASMLLALGMICNIYSSIFMGSSCGRSEESGITGDIHQNGGATDDLASFTHVTVCLSFFAYRVMDVCWNGSELAKYRLRETKCCIVCCPILCGYAL
eukprot:486886-Amphidinium_carterae.1